MKYARLVWGVILIVWGIFEFFIMLNLYESHGSYPGPLIIVIVLVIVIPTIIAGILLMLLGIFYKDMLVVFYILISGFAVLCTAPGIQTNPWMIWIILLISGPILLVSEEKRRTALSITGIIFLIIGLLFIFLAVLSSVRNPFEELTLEMIFENIMDNSYLSFPAIITGITMLMIVFFRKLKFSYRDFG